MKSTTIAEMMRDNIRQGSVYLILQVVVAVTNVASSIILARIFFADEYGLLALALLTVSIASALIDGWLSNATVRFQPFYKKKGKLDVFYSTLVFCILPIVILLSLLIPVYLMFNNYRSDTFQGLLPLTIMLTTLTICLDILLANFRVRLQAKRYAIVQAFKTVMGLLVGLLLVLRFGFGVDGILLGQIVVMLILVAIVFSGPFSSGSHVGLGSVSSSAFKKFAAYGIPLTVTSVGSLIITGADKYIIDFFWGNKDVGIYSMSSSIASMAISLIMSPLTLVVGPYIISVWESRNRGLAERLLAQLTRLTLLISLPMAVGLFVLSVPVLKLLTTPSYYPGSGAIPFIAGGAIFYGLSWLAGLGLALANRTSIAARNYLIAGGLDIFLNFLLVPLFGFVGSAMTYLVSSAFLLLLSAVSSRRYLEWVVLPRSTRNATLASIAMGMSVYLVILSFSSPLWQCIAGVGTGIAIYAIVLLLLGEFTQEEISEMKKLVK